MDDDEKSLDGIEQQMAQGVSSIFHLLSISTKTVESQIVDIVLGLTILICSF